MIYMGLWLILLGLLKKSVIADYIAQYNNWIFEDPVSFSGFENLMGILGYTVQIYCDFSGYSDLSIGMAAIMGIRLPDNFNIPYQSKNVTEFWHRWHISLSTWFRDYVYIPLGGNRKGKLRTYLNNLTTMLIAGLWHGATWMFVIWGGMHGIALIIHKLNQFWLRKIPNKWYVIFLSWMLTFTFVNITFVFFRATDMKTAWAILQQATFSMDWAYIWPFITARPTWTIMVLLVLLMHIVPMRIYSRLQTRFICSPWYVKLIIVITVFQLVVQFHTSNVQPFIYSQF
jgi:D-alanyl-lipoteichoic acid acyltransferase DltB (MBOAT superfamily)